MAHSLMLTTLNRKLVNRARGTYVGEALDDFIDDLRVGLFLVLLCYILRNIHGLERAVLDILDRWVGAKL